MKKIEGYQTNFEICIYAKKLLDKVIYLNSVVKVPPVGVLEVKKAIYYAKKYHGSQMRQSGEPFYSHPIEVSYMISDYLFRTDILVTSILHDTIEDTELTKEKILQEFGENIANQVIEMLYKEKKHDVLLIKLFDRLHNIQTIGAKSPEKAKKIINETLISFIVLMPYLGISSLEKHFYRLCFNITHKNRLVENTLLTSNLKYNFWSYFKHNTEAINII
ncbi:HD domain protein [Rickettsia endosymbiont of Ixodes pacificus]|uniref:HD domain-containing protein n=1 Tax=Rickettsia endosymbiont of Ixodes pacificus TaxID=1133329 RepID=UPI0005F7A8B1|nr:HD domain-containing protein [Rickettsia endosymbiont of Ixodes pacificus]KJW02672.1 HD domain protein [Rickettsia endosymbiont of Ixodes pacificus]